MSIKEPLLIVDPFNTVVIRRKLTSVENRLYQQSESDEVNKEQSEIRSSIHLRTESGNLQSSIPRLPSYHPKQLAFPLLVLLAAAGGAVPFALVPPAGPIKKKVPAIGFPS